MDIPTIPSLAAGQVVTADDLNNIGATCSFLLTKPMVRVHDETGGHAVTASYTDITWDTSDFDTDSIWTSGSAIRLTIATPGYYKVRYGLQIASSSTGRTVNTKAFLTTGANNPAGSGVTTGCLAGYAQEVSAGATVFAGASGIVPAYLYAGDWLRLRVYADTTGATTGTDSGMPYSFMSAEFASA